MLTVVRNGNGDVALVQEGWRKCSVNVFVTGINAKIAVRASIAAEQAGDEEKAREWELIAHRAVRSHFQPKGNAYPVYPGWTSTSRSKRSQMHDRWQEEVRRRVRLQAEIYAAGDDDFEALADIYEWAMHFDSDMSKPEPTIREDGGCWWQVGRNGGCGFFAGFMPDGKYGVAFADWMVDDDSYWRQRHCELGKEGYMGHY